MIRWTKDGKVDRAGWDTCGPSQSDYMDALCNRAASADQLADALDECVAALRWYADPVAYSMPVQDMQHHVFPDRGKIAQETLRRLGVDHDPQ